MLTFTTIFTIAFSLVTVHAAYFKDVSRSAGLDYSFGKSPKYGGPSVADLDGNGCPDLLFTHHGQGFSPEIYYNQCNGTFAKADFRMINDVHAINAVRFSPRDKRMHYIISLGGSRGTNPVGAKIYRINADRSIKEVTDQIGLGKLAQRGRSSITIDLAPCFLKNKNKCPHGKHLLFTSAEMRGVRTAMAGFRRTPYGKMTRVKITGDIADADFIHYVLPVDARNDGKMRLMTLRKLEVYEPVGYFRLANITHKVLPSKYSKTILEGVMSAGEADFNNDGLWDVYVGRTAKSLDWLENRKGFDHSDVLLQGTKYGYYKEVPTSKGKPFDFHTRGITTGDFDNNGWVDILVITYTGPNYFLMNNGYGSFTKRKTNWNKIGNAAGDAATAVDYNNDGRLDVIASEGTWGYDSQRGRFRIMKNVMGMTGVFGGKRNYLLVRVGSSMSYKATSLYAVVRIRVGNMKMMRRVGPPGVTVSISYIETVHFGIGNNKKVDFLEVRWMDGSKQYRKNLKANSLIKIGKF